MKIKHKLYTQPFNGQAGEYDYYPHQEYLYTLMENYSSLHVTKSRQIGITTLALDYAVKKCNEGQKVAYVAKSNMIQHVKCMLPNMPRELVFLSNHKQNKDFEPDVVIFDEFGYIDLGEIRSFAARFSITEERKPVKVIFLETKSERNVLTNVEKHVTIPFKDTVLYNPKKEAELRKNLSDEHYKMEFECK